MQEFWNKRYSESKYIYGKKPNQFLKEELSLLPAGRILFLGEGEGRNAVYAAAHGWYVDAVDFSKTGKEKAEKLAAEHGVKINYSIEDLSQFTPQQNFYDAAALIFIHLNDELRSAVNKKAIAALKPGGKIILEVFEKDQIKNESGGPKDEELLYSLEDVINDFIELDFEKFAKETIELNEGEYHKGKAAVIRFVGVKN
ncbi:MAG: class I SAM-dependent methyltransferase [Bacteroidota bacterium]